MDYGKYFDYYLELDIFLLADCFEFLRKKMFSTHLLDMVHFNGLPGFSQAAMMLKTKKQFHLIEDVEISRTIVKNLEVVSVVSVTNHLNSLIKRSS
jgi:hypothetical protein